MVQTTPFTAAGTGGTSQVGLAPTQQDLFLAQIESGVMNSSMPFGPTGTGGTSGMMVSQAAVARDGAQGACCHWSQPRWIDVAGNRRAERGDRSPPAMR